MSLYKRVLSALASKRFSLLILKIGVAYFLLLLILWVAGFIPPTLWMVWGPAILWFTLFLINLTISLVTKRYIFKGNLLFHMAFLLVAAGLVTSYLFRFEGSAIVMEGESFLGEEDGYTTLSYGLLRDGPPPLSFRLEEITPGYWRDELYFVRLHALIGYPSWEPERRSLVRLNGGARIHGVRLRLRGFGLFPVLRVERRGVTIYDGPVRALVFPPGSEDAVEIGAYRLSLRLFPNGVIEDGVVRNIGMEAINPLLMVGVEWLGRGLISGILQPGETLRAGGLAITFRGVREWVEFGMVMDPGEWLVFAGFLAALVGLLLRMARIPPRRDWNGLLSLRLLLILLVVIEGFYIGERWASTGHPPILGTFEESLASSFTILAFALLFDRANRFTLPALVFAGVTLLYGLNFDTTERPLVISEQSYWVYFHVLFAWIAYGFYTFSTMAAFYLRWRGGDGYVEEMMDRGLLMGFIAQSTMFFFGSYYSSRLHGRWWMWDPVEYLFVISWFLYAIPIHGRILFGWDRKRMAPWILLASVGTLLLYWGLIYFPWATYHVFDPQWKTHRGLVP